MQTARAESFMSNLRANFKQTGMSPSSLPSGARWNDAT